MSNRKINGEEFDKIFTAHFGKDAYNVCMEHFGIPQTTVGNIARKRGLIQREHIKIE